MFSFNKNEKGKQKLKNLVKFMYINLRMAN